MALNGTAKAKALQKPRLETEATAN